jgi:hypothetical protein
MKSNPKLTNYLLWNTKNYFVEAEKFVNLTNKFLFPSWTLWFEMVISPLITILICLYTKAPPDVFGLFGFYKCFVAWNEWLEYKNVKRDFIEWKQIVDASNGPFIRTNNTDYLAYVYADGMHRISNNQMKRQARPILAKNRST